MMGPRDPARPPEGSGRARRGLPVTARAGATGYPFTAPEVSPATKWRSSARNTTMAGRLLNSAPGLKFAESYWFTTVRLA